MKLGQIAPPSVRAANKLPVITSATAISKAAYDAGTIMTRSHKSVSNARAYALACYANGLYCVVKMDGVDYLIYGQRGGEMA